MGRVDVQQRALHNGKTLSKKGEESVLMANREKKKWSHKIQRKETIEKKQKKT